MKTRRRGYQTALSLPPAIGKGLVFSKHFLSSPQSELGFFRLILIQQRKDSAGIDSDRDISSHGNRETVRGRARRMGGGAPKTRSLARERAAPATARQEAEGKRRARPSDGERGWRMEDGG